MRGNPLVQLVLVFAVFLALGVPVWRLTRPALPATPVIEPMPTEPTRGASNPLAEAVTLETTLNFAPVAAGFTLSHLDQTVLQGKEQGSLSGAWKTILPAEGADLVLHATWPTAPDAGSAAARVTIRFPDGRTVEKSFWASGGGPLDAVVTVPGSKGEPRP